MSCQNDETITDKSEAISENAALQNVGMEMPLVEFNAWVAAEENNLVKLKSVSEINYKMSFVPKEIMAFNELKSSEYTKEDFETALTHYKDMSYFNFRIEIPEGEGELLKHKLSSPQQYDARINYMSFKMQQDIILVQNNDTLFPGIFHFERIFEIAPFTTVMIAFDNQKFNPEKEFTIIYNDQLFNKGYLKYYYQPNLLIDLPKINSL
jgi:hypothetical protein